MPEYGRNIQMMVDYILTIEDKEQRQKNAYAIIELMGVLNPHLKNVEDFRHKLWDHIYRISDFKIEIDSPYPTPTRDEMMKKPEPVPYPQKSIRNRHIGRNISQIIDRAVSCEDDVKKKGYVNSIAYYMKLSYANWHKEQVQDDIIKEELRHLSNGALDYVPGDARTPKFNTAHKKHAQNNNQNRNKGNHNKNRNGSNPYHAKNQKPGSNRSFGQKNG